MTSPKKIQLENIAFDLGLSKSTVSRAISGKGRISKATRSRVMEYIDKHDYRPNIIAKSLAQSKTYNLGVVLPEDTMELPFFHNCLMGICGACLMNDYDVVVTVSTENDISGLRKLVEHNKVDGVILTRTVKNDACAAYIEKKQLPAVLIGSSGQVRMPQVDNDHIRACAELTGRMLEEHSPEKTALLLGKTSHIVNQRRRQGFDAAFEKIGRKPSPELVKVDLGTKPQIVSAVGEIMKLAPSCVICGDDYICATLIRALREMELSPPRDIKAASFYGSRQLRDSFAGVTAVEMNAKRLGEEAGLLLIDILSGKPAHNITITDYEIV